jgi:hypothetical protein
MAQLEFDENLTKQLEVMYRRRDVMRRRRLVHNALAASGKFYFSCTQCCFVAPEAAIRGAVIGRQTMRRGDLPIS